jgi:hypothetical protein
MGFIEGAKQSLPLHKDLLEKAIKEDQMKPYPKFEGLVFYKTFQDWIEFMKKYTDLSICQSYHQVH